MLGQRQKRWANDEAAVGECRICWVICDDVTGRLQHMGQLIRANIQDCLPITKQNRIEYS